MIGRPLFVTHFPAEKEAFNMRRVGEDETLTESVDLVILCVGEIVGGRCKSTTMTS